MAILQSLRRSDFLRHNFIFFVGSTAVGVLNYLYYPVMSRVLHPAAFGEVQALISLFLQITIFLTVLSLVTINIVANYQSETQRDAVVLEFEHLALLVSIVLLLITVACQNVLKRFLQFDATWPFILLMLAVVASVPMTFRGAFLRGKQRFGLASAVNIISAGSKIVFSAALVVLGGSTAGAIGGLVAAQIAACLAALGWARKDGLRRPTGQGIIRLPNMKLLRPELPYGMLVLVGSLFVTVQYSIDIVVVKHLFDPHTAGLYAGVASVARIIFFLTASISLVLMPLVKMGAAPGENERLLKKSLGLVLAAGLPVLALFVLAPKPIVTLLMGHAYGSVAYLLPTLSGAIFAVSIINLLVAYHLALRHFAMVPSIIIGAAITYGLVAVHHSTLRAVVTSLLIGSIAMLSILIISNKRLTTRS